MLGSANISGSKAMHLMSGNLSHQIEHHLFPDLPSNRYAEVAPKVQALFEKYDLTYCSRPMPQQVYSAWHKVVRLSLPNGWLATTNLKNLPEQAQLLWAMGTKGPKVRRAAAAGGARRAGRGRLIAAILPDDRALRPGSRGPERQGLSLMMGPCDSPSTS